MNKQPSLLDSILKHIHEADSLLDTSEVVSDVSHVFKKPEVSALIVVDGICKRIICLEQERKGLMTRLTTSSRKIQTALHHQRTTTTEKISRRLSDHQEIGTQYRHVSEELIALKTQLFDVASAYYFRLFLYEKSQKVVADAALEQRFLEVEEEKRKLDREIAALKEEQRLLHILIQDKQHLLVESLSLVNRKGLSKSAETIHAEIAEHLEEYKELYGQIRQKEGESDPFFDVLTQESFPDSMVLPSLSIVQMRTLYLFKKDLRSLAFGSDLKETPLKTVADVYPELLDTLTEQEKKFLAISK